MCAFWQHILGAGDFATAVIGTNRAARWFGLPVQLKLEPACVRATAHHSLPAPIISLGSFSVSQSSARVLARISSGGGGLCGIGSLLSGPRLGARIFVVLMYSIYPDALAGLQWQNPADMMALSS